ncbi:hypothetical protein BC828DRAFT_374857 [Blastocladiella britannica]|nr:hypothetical protein BC828DRAFT_374857 [Blastocladiella britannica]
MSYIQPQGTGLSQNDTNALYQRFQQADTNRSGTISAQELHTLLGLLGYQQFNLETCRMLIGLHDFDRNGTVDFNEFCAMWQYITQWNYHFRSFDQDNSGTIDARELQQALQRFGFNLTPEICAILVRKYDTYDRGSITFDSFVQCCVTMQGLTRAFQQRDVTRTGTIQIGYYDFLTLVMGNGL